MGDTDEANDGKGDHVLTWRITVPKGEPWGSSPADEVELLDNSGLIVYKRKLREPFRISPSHPSVLYLNLVLRESH